MISAQALYNQTPDKLYVGQDPTVWYAFYDSQFAVLTNAYDNRLKVYQYDDKTEYRDVRRTVIERYDLRQTTVETDYD